MAIAPNGDTDWQRRKAEKDVEKSETHRTDYQHSAFHRDGSGLGIEREREPTDFREPASSGPGTGGSPNVPVERLYPGAEMEKREEDDEAKKK